MDVKNRHIVNLKFESSRRRIYLMWKGDSSSNGSLELEVAMKHIESTLGPKAKSTKEFYDNCIEHFKQNAFVEFKS